MVKFITGLIVSVVAVAVMLLSLVPLLGPPDVFVGLLAAAVLVLFGSLVVAARAHVTPRTFTVGVGVSLAAVAVFAVGMRSSVVVDGTVIAHTATPAQVSRQISDLQAAAQPLQDAHDLLSSSAADQFARTGLADELSQTCTSLNTEWSKIVPASDELVAAVKAVKEGALACVQGTKVSAQSSSTPDEKTTVAIQVANTAIEASLTELSAAIENARAAYSLPGEPS